MFTIDEEPLAGTVIGTVAVSSSEGEVTLSIVSQSPEGAVAIDGTSGQLTVADASTFDFETNPQIVLTVEGTVGSLSARAEVTITLEDIDENAFFAEDFAGSIAENQARDAVIGTINARPGTGVLSFQLTDTQDPRGALQVNANTGALAVFDATLWNFERFEEITATVLVGNGEESEEVTVTVTMLNTPDEWVTNTFGQGFFRDAELGSDVSITPDGSIFAVSSPFTDQNSFSSVQPYVDVYRRGDSMFTTDSEDDRITQSDFEAFGFSLELNNDGSRLVVGGFGVTPVFIEGQPPGRDAVRVFEDQNGSWVQLGSTLDDDQVVNQAGTSVAISGDGETIAYGVPQTQTNPAGAGFVRVLTYDGEDWTLVDEQITSPNMGDRFGEMLSMSDDGTLIAVGAPRTSGGGVVYVYENSGSEGWQLVGEPLAIGGDEGSVSLSADGTTLAVGEPFDDAQRGLVRVYSRSGDSWTPLGDDLAGVNTNDRFGIDLQLNNTGSILIVGASFAESLNAGIGAAGVVYSYRLADGEWTMFAPPLSAADQGINWREFGVAVAVDDAGQTLVVGTREDQGFTEIRREGGVMAFTYQ